MSSPTIRRRKRGQDDTPDTNQGAPVTLTSREFIGKLLSEYRENTKAAEAAEGEAKRGFTDAARFEQQAADLAAKEQAAFAKLQQAEAELKQVQAELKETHGFAEQARDYGRTQTANHEGYKGQAADAKKVLDQFGIAIPQEPLLEQVNAPAPTSPMPLVNGGYAPAPISIEPDPIEAARMDKSFAAIDAARAELPADQRDEGEL